MTRRQLVDAVKKFDGWIEGEKAYFPTPHLKDEFEKYCAQLG